MDSPPEKYPIEKAQADGQNVSVVRCDALDTDADWMKSIAGDLKSKILFVWPPQGGKVNNYAFDHGGGTEWNGSDDAAMATTKPTPEWVFTPSGLEKQIAAEVEEGFEALAEQLRSPMGVIPFVGAGMSKGFGFADWGEFLKGCAAGLAKRAEIEGLVDQLAYEEAAEQIASVSGDRFQRRIAYAFGRTVEDTALRSSPLPLLSQLTEGPVITTNFDRVLEQAFRLAGRPFEEVVAGPRPDSIVRAIHQNRRILLKIHGDCLERTQRTFSKSEYDQNWGKRGEEGSLGRLAWLMFANRPLLFLGYSLQTDRTVDALEKIHKMLPGVAHFAVLAAHYVPTKLDKRRAELDSWGVIPLWFLPSRFAAIKDLLSRLLTAVSVRKIADSAAARKIPNTYPWLFRIFLRFPHVPPLSNDLKEEPAEIPTELSHVIERIAREVIRGRIVLFLGSGAHLGNVVSGNQFYERIAEKFGCQDLRLNTTELDRSAVARYVIDRYGYDALVDEARALLSVDRIPASVVYQFVAWLAIGATGSRGPLGQPMILFTTNQDRMVARVLHEVRAPFHEFKYIGSGPMDGHFAWRRSDGRIDLVERPENLNTTGTSDIVVVKMNGGFSEDPIMPESVLLARGDFERLAGRLPAVLPAVLRTAIRDRSLLFLGHGLNEPDTEALIRYSSPNGVLKSWAVHKPDEMMNRANYWENCGLELIPCDLKIFVRHLYKAITAQLRIETPAARAAGSSD